MNLAIQDAAVARVARPFPRRYSYRSATGGTFMFVNAFTVANSFTRPIVISTKTIGGKCTSSIGAFVLVNDEGWFVTAFHIIRQINELEVSVTATRAALDQRQAIDANLALSKGEKKRQLAAIPRPRDADIERYSTWWGDGAVQLELWAGRADVDIGIGKFKNFVPGAGSTFPTFKDPDKGYELGASLCRLGYPFHSVTPTWNASLQRFDLPAGAVPVPCFVNEGIYSRGIDFGVAQPPAPPIPLLWIETSTPGLRGQSGGPIFDAQGTIWAIQSNTFSYPLGFNPDAPGRPGHQEHQFLNVGRGVHAKTIVGFLKMHNVKFIISSY